MGIGLLSACDIALDPPGLLESPENLRGKFDTNADHQLLPPLRILSSHQLNFLLC